MDLISSTKLYLDSLPSFLTSSSMGTLTLVTSTVALAILAYKNRAQSKADWKLSLVALPLIALSPMLAATVQILVQLYLTPSRLRLTPARLYLICQNALNRGAPSKKHEGPNCSWKPLTYRMAQNSYKYHLVIQGCKTIEELEKQLTDEMSESNLPEDVVSRGAKFYLHIDETNSLASIEGLGALLNSKIQYRSQMIGFSLGKQWKEESEVPYQWPKDLFTDPKHFPNLRCVTLHRVHSLSLPPNWLANSSVQEVVVKGCRGLRNLPDLSGCKDLKVFKVLEVASDEPENYVEISENFLKGCYSLQEVVITDCYPKDGKLPKNFMQGCKVARHVCLDLGSIETLPEVFLQESKEHFKNLYVAENTHIKEVPYSFFKGFKNLRSLSFKPFIEKKLDLEQILKYLPSTLTNLSLSKACLGKEYSEKEINEIIEGWNASHSTSPEESTSKRLEISLF